jgi:GTP-binding protein
MTCPDDTTQSGFAGRCDRRRFCFTIRVTAPLRLTFVQSATTFSQLPDIGPEVAVVGRSNVGKSSLINALAAKKGLAKVSNTPGRTQLINLFALETGGALVDLPGFGYAKVSKTMRAGWSKMIDAYLLNSENLRMVMALVDGEIGPTKLDVQLLDWLRAEGLPHQVIATKHDKVRSTGRERRKKDLAEGLHLEKGDVVWVSADKGVGIDDLRKLIQMWVSE